MPKLKCKCGEILSYSEIPCSIEYKFISDIDFDKFQGKIDVEELYMQMKSFIKCKKCGRIWVFWSGFQVNPIEYVQAEES